MNSRIRALLIVLLVWAVVYLPALGSLAIKGEEGRRILPAIQMLKTGDYVVPQVGSNPYFRKPPLVNWLVAGSFKFLPREMNGRPACLQRLLCSRWQSLLLSSRARASALRDQ